MAESPGQHAQVAVLLGTDHHPYDRLVEWAATLAAEDGQRWFVQHGFTRWPDVASADLPANLTGTRMLGVRELDDLLAHADVVITHGGPSLIQEARTSRHVPIVAPRDPALGEHVDGHQIDFTARLAADGTIRLVRSLDDLRLAVAATRHEGRPTTADAVTPDETVERFATLVEGALSAPRVGLLARLALAGRRVSPPPAGRPARRPGPEPPRQ
ncbi:glycosyltransferase [Nocardioides jishulii]|uniref:Glycosyl transferase family 28 n=1 Tax=Nocardioides jishulii TaxID=2575440 RepID=A0A4U2YJE5_9ACTN|nr:glycosyltransferase [Nocardioides jishulii]QCX26793.1 glycosyl transferase family 28 [Nocardioides jishulii]TKI61277.1 glycosyl transferase family 28 [Nocardioides jishulii]